MSRTWRQRAVGRSALILMSAVICALAVDTAFAEEELLGEGNDGNRSGPVHLIPLYAQIFADDDPVEIRPDSKPALPFSVRATCGECHDYANIAGGWHFNSSDPQAPAGRPGEPWVLVDRTARTLLPVSGRAWKGTFTPEHLGISSWEMAKQFGRHMPGGDWGERFGDSDDGLDRLDASGKFEINCLACHNGDHRQDQSEAALQGLRENYRWIPTASSGLGVVSGLASSASEAFDPLMDDDVQVQYDAQRFDAKNAVFMDIAGRPPADRCYFCHSLQKRDLPENEAWQTDEDIHLTGGMTCVDCHRNGDDHRIVRGYEGEVEAENKPLSARGLTCEGCHLGDQGGQDVAAASGRLGAPRPEHKGFPTIHFQKLSCTACHSGPWPNRQNQYVRTPRIHRLGLHGKHRLDMTLPHVASPVFVTSETTGKITASRMIWPAYWGRMGKDQISPIPPETVKKQAGDLLAVETVEFKNDWLEIAPDQIAAVLTALKAEGQAEPVYVAGGKLYRLAGDGLSVRTEDHPGAQPYSWPLAHNVRPAQQSLGVNGCDDCHTIDSPFFFGEVAVDTPVSDRMDTAQPRYQLAGQSGTYWWAFNASFVFRPMLKTVGFVCAGLLGLILLAYALAGLRWVLRRIQGPIQE
ncbi:MAG: hypothetical protein JW810_14280 [Sedimentisphaerales bacterium]|nr:hypothetical protein [Sedimentisphaerales bacterium]